MKQKKVSIAHVGLRGVPAIYGGVDRVVEEIGKGLAKRGNKIVVYCWKNIYRRRVRSYENIELVYLPTVPLKYFL